MTTTPPNVHSADMFQQAYGNRKPDFYGPVLSEIIRYGKAGSVIDLGAGLGLLCELGQKWGIKFTGLEGSTYAIEQALVRCPSLEMQLHDLGDPLPFGDASIANVVLNQVIEHIDYGRACRVLRECLRVLMPGGKLFVYSPSRYNREERKEPTHIHMLLPSELHILLEDAGFYVEHEPNHGLWFASSAGRVLPILGKVLWRVCPADWISATSNAVAVKKPCPPARTRAGNN